MMISPNELRKASEEFKKASDESNEIIHKLELVMKNLETSWNDTGQQIFYKYFQEWQVCAGSISQLETLIANELDKIAEKYFDADDLNAS